MEDSKEEKQNINHNGILSESEIYQKNKETNKNKIKENVYTMEKLKQIMKDEASKIDNSVE